MKDLPIEHVCLYLVVDTKGYTRNNCEIAFIRDDDEAGFKNYPSKIGTLEPFNAGYRYLQISIWPYPHIDAYILRKIADRIDTLNARAKAQKES